MFKNLIHFIFRAKKTSNRLTFLKELAIVCVVLTAIDILFELIIGYREGSGMSGHWDAITLYWIGFLKRLMYTICIFNVFARRMLDLGYGYWKTILNFVPFINLYYNIRCLVDRTKVEPL